MDKEEEENRETLHGFLCMVGVFMILFGSFSNSWTILIGGSVILISYGKVFNAININTINNG